MGRRLACAWSACYEQVTDSSKWRRLNGGLVLAWIAFSALAVSMGWLSSVGFVAALSLYANVASHLGTWAAARAEAKQEEVS